MERETLDEEIRRLYLRNAPLVGGNEVWEALQDRLPASARSNQTPSAKWSPRRPRRPLRALGLAFVTVILLSGLGTGIFEAATHLGGHRVTILIRDETTSSSFAPATETSSINLGPANDINLTAVWLEVASKAGFDPKAAKAWDVELDYSPSGSLVHLLLIASIDQEVRASWDGYGGKADQVVRASVTVAGFEGGTESFRDYPVHSVLAAIEAVGANMNATGAKSLVAKLPAVGAKGNYRLMFLDSSQGSLPPNGNAYIWDGSAFQPLTSSERSRKLDSEHIVLSVTARKPVPQKIVTSAASTSSTEQSTATTSASATTSAYESIGIAYFVLPIPGTTTSGESLATSMIAGHAQTNALSSFSGESSTETVQASLIVSWSKQIEMIWH